MLLGSEKITINLLFILACTFLFIKCVCASSDGEPLMVSSDLASTNCTTIGNLTNSTAIQVGNCQNLLYYMNAGIGSQDQVLAFQIYTGVTLPWVILTNGSQYDGFNFQVSTTVNITNTTAVIVYPDNSLVNGTFGSDFLQISGTSIDSQIDLVMVTQYSGNGLPPFVVGSLDFQYDGPFNIFDNAFKNGQITTAVFALDLNLGNQTSFIFYNNGLPPLVAQQTLWVDQIQTSFNWQAQIISMSVQGIQVTQYIPTSGIFNTGASYLNFDANLYAQISSQYFNGTFCFQQNGFNICPCNSQTNWPTFSFMMLGAEIYIPPSMYKVRYTYTGLCQALILGIADANTIIFGLPAFWNYTISFDKQHSRMGFYGRSQPVYVISGKTGYFLLTQYIMCGVMLALFISGLTVHIARYIRNRHKLLDEQTQYLDYPKIIKEQEEQTNKKPQKQLLQMQMNEL